MLNRLAVLFIGGAALVWIWFAITITIDIPHNVPVSPQDMRLIVGLNAVIRVLIPGSLLFLAESLRRQNRPLGAALLSGLVLLPLTYLLLAWPHPAEPKNVPLPPCAAGAKPSGGCAKSAPDPLP